MSQLYRQNTQYYYLFKITKKKCNRWYKYLCVIYILVQLFWNQQEYLTKYTVIYNIQVVREVDLAIIANVLYLICKLLLNHIQLTLRYT